MAAEGNVETTECTVQSEAMTGKPGAKVLTVQRQEVPGEAEPEHKSGAVPALAHDVLDNRKSKEHEQESAISFLCSFLAEMSPQRGLP